jgi:hypothetical protein
MRNFQASPLVVMDYAEILSEVTIDNYHFKVTWSPIRKNSCILWIRDSRLAKVFEALGQFSEFDKRNVLFFISRYVTSNELRQQIDSLRFERRIAGLSPTFFREIERMSAHDKQKAYRHLFDLDDQMHTLSLSARRRIMARKFHPDIGGNNDTMALINQAHDFLVDTSAS